MPGVGIHNPVVGYAVFCAVKFAGYSLAAWGIGRAYREPHRNAFVVGGTRTLIGMAAGAAYFGIVQLTANYLHGAFPEVAGPIAYLAGLLPVRLIEWWFLIWLFYDRPLEKKKLGWAVVSGGTVWSYLCDIPAIAGFLATGGFSVC